MARNNRPKRSGPMGQGRDGEEKGKTRTVWKKDHTPPPAGPGTDTVTVVHERCGTAFDVVKGSGGPKCSVCGRL